MLDIFYEGGWEFMSIISLLGLCMLYFTARAAVAVWGRGKPYPFSRLYYIRFFGMLALVVGVLGQILGLYSAMQLIPQVGEMPQAVMASGIRVSSITTLYGLSIFVIAHVLWFVLDLKAKHIIEKRGVERM